jgi:endonuclease/exonuclease/phosphatase family metal-dependent hydrolase
MKRIDRRGFLAAGCGLAAGYSQAAQATGVVRSTRVVPKLTRISHNRRKQLEVNAKGETAAALNKRIPEIEAIELDNSISRANPQDSVKLIAWNTERGRYWKEGAELIRSHPALRDPDVIFLGEMDLGMARSGNLHTTREMALALKMNYAYGVEFLEFTNGEPEERKLYPAANEWGYHGNAILSRYPLRDLRMIRFPGIEKWYADYQKRLGGRMALLATIDAGRTLTLVSTHLESSASDAPARESETRMLLEEIERSARGTPILLGGDLNAPPAEPAIRLLREAGFLIDEANEMSIGTSQKMVDGAPALTQNHIDYICVRGLRPVRDEHSPKALLAVDPNDKDKLLADHAIVVLKVAIAG